MYGNKIGRYIGAILLLVKSTKVILKDMRYNHAISMKQGKKWLHYLI